MNVQFSTFKHLLLHLPQPPDNHKAWNSHRFVWAAIAAAPCNSLQMSICSSLNLFQKQRKQQRRPQMSTPLITQTDVLNCLSYCLKHFEYYEVLHVCCLLYDLFGMYFSERLLKIQGITRVALDLKDLGWFDSAGNSFWKFKISIIQV